MEQIERFKTRNLNLASFLAASGLQLVGSARSRDSVFFEFIPQDKAKALVEAYFTDKAIVNPKELFSKLNELRDLIFSSGKDEVKL